MSAALPIQLIANVDASQASQVVTQALSFKSLDQLKTSNGVYSAKEIADVIVGPIHDELTQRLEDARHKIASLIEANDKLELSLKQTATKLFTTDYVRKVHSGIYKAVYAVARQLTACDCTARDNASSVKFLVKIVINNVKPCLKTQENCDVIASFDVDFQIHRECANGSLKSVSSTDVEVELHCKDVDAILKSATNKLSQESVELLLDMAKYSRLYKQNCQNIDSLQIYTNNAQRDLRKLGASAKSVLHNMSLTNLQTDAQACEQAKLLGQQIRASMSSLE
jgi:hypothetical protein